MSKVYTDTVTSTEASQDLTLGGSGDNVIVTAGATLKTNTVKDSGGNTLWTSDGSGNLSSVNAGLAGGNMVLLSTQTASNAASVSFTSGIDNTYRLYIFKFYNVNPATDNVQFQMTASVDGGSSYGVTATTTFFRAVLGEGDSGASLAYITAADLAQSASAVPLTTNQGNAADENSAGEIHLFNPSSTTYVKHFYVRTGGMSYNNYSQDDFCAGYWNTTDDIDAIQFSFSSGNVDAVIKMYGLG